jgi:Na+-driven multidrug efflux pump
MTASGVALATTMSQYLGAFLTIRCLMHQDDETRLLPSLLRMHRKEVVGIVRFGVPSGLTNAMYSASNIQIQSAINTFDAAAVAGSGAVSSLENFLGSGHSAMNASAVAFAGQNIGAGNQKRAKKSIFTCLFLAMGLSVVLGNLIYIIGEPVYRLYIHDPQALAVADIRASIMLTLYFLLAVQSIMGAAVQVYGYPVVSAIISLIGVFGFRTIWMQFIYPRFETLEAIFYCYPVTWVIMAIATFLSYLVVYRLYKKKGEYRHGIS